MAKFLTDEQANKLIKITKALTNRELSYLQYKDKGLQQLGWIINFDESYDVDITDEQEFKKFLTSTPIEELQEATLSVSLPNEIIDEYSEEEVYTLTQLVTKPIKFYAVKEVVF